MSGIPTGVQSTSIAVQRKAYCHAAGRDAQGQEVNVRCKVIQRLSMLSANGGADLSGDWLAELLCFLLSLSQLML